MRSRGFTLAAAILAEGPAWPCPRRRPPPHRGTPDGRPGPHQHRHVERPAREQDRHAPGGRDQERRAGFDDHVHRVAAGTNDPVLPSGLDGVRPGQVDIVGSGSLLQPPGSDLRWIGDGLPVGDLNGDGRPELTVGVPEWSTRAGATTSCPAGGLGAARLSAVPNWV
ncbi:hypothetical protein [Spirillospora sp. CA-128828]|uniref:hypothetical protein n=1 Tax=Spirillospora sp. CA-128828 TaxID=3240033 RepID=UPI003D92FDBA